MQKPIIQFFHVNSSIRCSNLFLKSTWKFYIFFKLEAFITTEAMTSYYLSSSSSKPPSQSSYSSSIYFVISFIGLALGFGVDALIKLDNALRVVVRDDTLFSKLARSSLFLTSTFLFPSFTVIVVDGLGLLILFSFP